MIICAGVLTPAQFLLPVAGSLYLISENIFAVKLYGIDRDVQIVSNLDITSPVCNQCQNMKFCLSKRCEFFTASAQIIRIKKPHFLR